MLKKRNVLIVLVLLVVAGLAFWFLRDGQEEEVRTETVRRGTVVETVSITGQLTPVEYADLSLSSLGEIKKIFVQEGDQVLAGQVIASINTSVLMAQLRESQLALAQAEEAEQLARRNWDSLKPEERNAKKLATEQAREAVGVVQAQIARTRLVAPLTGTLAHLDIREGEVATAGQILARVVGSPDLILEARVPESDIAKIAIGMKAKVDFDALENNRLLEAEVVNIDQTATVVQDVVSYIVTLQLTEMESRLKSGMTADVDIETARSDNTLLVPFRVLTREGDTVYAERIGTDNSRERVEVTVGVEGDDGTTEVLSGLKEGDRVTIGTSQKN